MLRNCGIIQNGCHGVHLLESMLCSRGPENLAACIDLIRQSLRRYDNHKCQQKKQVIAAVERKIREQHYEGCGISSRVPTFVQGCYAVTDCLIFLFVSLTVKALLN